MNCVLLRRKYSEPIVDITVTITGNGNVDSCYETIGGVKRYSAGTYTVRPGDTITFGVRGASQEPGWVKIDGVTVLNVTNRTTQTYVWTVPSGVRTISIANSYTQAGKTGRITVTTT